MNQIENIGFIDKTGGVHQSNNVITSLGLSSTVCAGCGVKYWINVLEIKPICKEKLNKCKK